MGCDIHAAIEYRDTSGWKALMVPNKLFGKYTDELAETARLDISRDYELFAILANVRNSYGFAGCDTGDRFNPISDMRGLPPDVTEDAKSTGLTGDHSDTWVGLPEILSFDWGQKCNRRGVITAVEFAKWDRIKEYNPVPDSYCGSRSGAGVQDISEEEMRVYVNAIMHNELLGNWDARVKRLNPLKQTRVTWTVSYAKAAEQLWTAILPHMLKLGSVHGYDNVRLVMNFDS